MPKSKSADEDSVRFNALYDRYRKQMYLVAFRVLQNSHDAEDAVQNALWALSRYIKSVPQDNARATRAYVLTAAKNAALAMLPAQHHVSLEDIPEQEHPTNNDPFVQLASSQDYELLLRVINQLDLRYREVLMLIYVQELNIAETAHILCRKEETVRKQLFRGKKLLLELCRKEGLRFETD